MADPQNDLKNPDYNMEPGVTIVEGSKYQQYMRQFEQHHSPLAGRQGPGNPYVYRPFPKMLYRAELFQGKVACRGIVPSPWEFRDPAHLRSAQEQADEFTKRCQRIVGNETEMQAAMESGWRESEAEAVEYLEARQRSRGDAAARLNYEDRNLPEPAQRERAAELAEAHSRGEHLVEVPEKRRGRPRKIVQA
jgi:hypothetical protein